MARLPSHSKNGYVIAVKEQFKIPKERIQTYTDTAAVAAPCGRTAAGRIAAGAKYHYESKNSYKIESFYEI